MEEEVATHGDVVKRCLPMLKILFRFDDPFLCLHYSISRASVFFFFFFFYSYKVLQ